MSTPWPWPVGTVVVCVDAADLRHPQAPLSRPLVEGELYTVRESFEGNQVSAVLLQEIRCAVCYTVGRMTGHELGFQARRFRPLESDHTETEQAERIKQQRDITVTQTQETTHA